jgi:diguanylate cyclase (GGDEF)-like protein
MPPLPGSDPLLLRAFEAALREGRLLDEAIGGILDAALSYFDASAVVLLPAGGAPPISRAGRSIVASAAEQSLTKLLEEILVSGREKRSKDSGIAFLGVPVKVADQVKASFGLALGQSAGREGDQEEGARLFARSVAHILERDRTVSTLIRRREEAVALFELASGALHSLNADEVIRLTVASLSRELEFDQVKAHRFLPDTREVEEILSHGSPNAAGPAGRRPIDDEELLVRCLSAHGPAFEDDLQSGTGPTRRRRLALPLQAGETVFGFLTMSRKGSFVLTPQEMRLAQELSRLAAGALEKARLIDAERRTTERIAFIARLHTSLGGLTEIDTILHRTVKELGPYFDLDYCAVRLVATGEFPGAAAVYVKTGAEAPRRGEEIPDSLFSHLSGEGSHLLLSDVSSDPRGFSLIPSPDTVKTLTRPISLLAVPLAYRGAIVGVLAAVTGGRLRGIGTTTLRSFEAVAVELSLAVTSARLLLKERDSYRFLDRLREVGRSLTTTFDSQRIKQILCEQSVALLKADVAQFWDAEPNGKTLEVTARWGLDSSGDAGRTVATDKTSHPVVRAFLEKGLVLVNDAEAGDLFSPASPSSGAPIARAAVVPLVHQDEPVGLLSLGLRRGSAPWSGDVAGQLALLADSGAIALHNARMMRIIEAQAERDSQTGLYNRTAILKRLEGEIRRAERNGQSIAVAYSRLDGLAEAYQRLGAPFGEALLPRAAAQLVRATRAVNVVARDRGDRFWILIFDATKAQAQRAVESIQKNFDGAVDARLDQEGIRLGVTVGIAAYPEDAFDTSSLVLRAEEALDVAMNGPKGSIALYGALSASDVGP